MRIEQLGGLRARLLGGADGQGGGDGPLVVLMHGFGAPGDDLVELARFMRVPKSVRFLFPEAPLSLDEGFGRAWWLLDLALFERRARGERVDRSQEVPDGLKEARELVLELLHEAETRLAAPLENVILGGFSQGSMLACDVTLHSATKPKGLLLLSSTLIAESEWRPRMASCAGLPILQTHGEFDPLLAYEDAEKLRELWRNAGAKLSFLGFPGAHEIPREVLDATSRFISELVQ